MKRILPLLAFILAVTATVPFVAARGTLTNEYRQCQQAAYEQRESAYVEMAHTYYNELEAAIETRRQRMIDAWDQQEESDVQTALRDADREYRDAKRDIESSKRDAERSIQQDFRNEERACRDVQKFSSSSRSSSSRSSRVSSPRSSRSSSSRISSYRSSSRNNCDDIPNNCEPGYPCIDQARCFSSNGGLYSRCVTSNQCDNNLTCSTEFGDCRSYCHLDDEPCIQLCTGLCVPRMTFNECSNNNDCNPGYRCSDAGRCVVRSI